MSIRYINREGYISDAMECTQCGAEWAGRHSTTHNCPKGPSSEEKLAVALEALEFYAEESNWEIDHDDCGNGYVREGSDYRPPGTRAREAIAKIKGEK